MTGTDVKRIAIVNRSFWPDALMGDALLLLAERLAETLPTKVICQSNHDLHELIRQQGRGGKVDFGVSRKRAGSNANILVRLLDALWFALFVFFSLVKWRPSMVYVATDPPIVVPFFVCLYAKLFGAKFVYHIQDIHPEITQTLVHVSPIMAWLLKWVDNKTLASASRIITLTPEMLRSLERRLGREVDADFLDNPALLNNEAMSRNPRENDFIFCGNAGRLQRIPLLLAAIKQYLNQGGKAHFTFVGGGIYVDEIKQIANDYEQVAYHGQVSAEEAAMFMARHKWGIMPIEDTVMDYAFPSKSSSYLMAGCRVLAVCGDDTAVANWVRRLDVGEVCKPDVASLCQAFSTLYRTACEPLDLSELTELYSVSYFSKKLSGLVLKT